MPITPVKIYSENFLKAIFVFPPSEKRSLEVILNPRSYLWSNFFPRLAQIEITITATTEIYTQVGIGTGSPAA